MQPVSIISFGEILLRISPQLDQQQAQIYVGGAEANVAAALGQWGNKVAYISRFPQNGLSDQVLIQLQAHGIQTDRVLWGGDRIGIYFLAQGSDLKHAEVVYDRKYASFSEIKPGTIDWKPYLQHAQWLHWSAIAPALNERSAKVCLEVLKAARELGLKISTDLNYRSKLWQYGKEPIDIMPELVSYCDIIMGNIWAARQMLGIPFTEGGLDGQQTQRLLEASMESAAGIFQQYPQCKQVAFTFRFSDAPSHNRYFGVLQEPHKQYVSKVYESHEVVDRVGSGDCFMAGLLHANVQGYTPEDTIAFATAAAYSKFFVKGDFNKTSIAQIQQYL